MSRPARARSLDTIAHESTASRVPLAQNGPGNCRSTRVSSLHFPFFRFFYFHLTLHLVSSLLSFFSGFYFHYALHLFTTLLSFFRVLFSFDFAPVYNYTFLFFIRLYTCLQLHFIGGVCFHYGLHLSTTPLSFFKVLVSLDSAPVFFFLITCEIILLFSLSCVPVLFLLLFFCINHRDYSSVSITIYTYFFK